MALSKFLGLFLIHIALLSSSCFAADPFVFYDFEVSYITASPLGVPQQVIAINNKFPGPTINSTTNNNVVINVRNKLDESLLLHWWDLYFAIIFVKSGIQQRRSSWQDGLPGTNCPIPPKWNWTYQFQVKDQIGSFFYFPSLHFQRAAGGFGGFIINNRDIIPIPFGSPDGDITILIGDWYTRNHTALRKALDAGKDLGMPDGVLINGKGPYQYNDTLVPDGIDYETIDVHPGKTYRLRVHNVGISTSLNFRIQSHNLLLAENRWIIYDQNASSDYYIVASARFVNESQWKRVTGVAILRYSNSKGKAAGPLPDPPQDEYDKTFSMNQARSIRRTTLSRISFVNPATPIWLAERLREYISLIFQVDHLQGHLKRRYRMDYGEWSENSKGTYNKWDGIARSTTQVYPGAWTAILISLDNVGVWNLRTENLDSWYLGQETYIRVVNPEVTNKTELPMPENVLYCGALSKRQKPQDISFATSITTSSSKLFLAVLMVASALLFH
ncbi:hypothetical protein GOBAR_DD20643 [Gossypium barbadense]|nr:hypothetical protein GOBAR_DD20643 [Gossypium barbadense]